MTVRHLINKVWKHYQGSEAFGDCAPLGTIGYRCRIESADYVNGRLLLTVNSGLSERCIRLRGSAAQSFMIDMDVSESSACLLGGRRVSVLLNSQENIERIGRR